MLKPLTIAVLPCATFCLFAVPSTVTADTAACPISVPSDEILGDTFLCDQIKVPQNWSDPEGVMIPISYVVLKSTSLAPLPDPVIYFQGGPGGSALNSLSLISGGTEALRASRDVIFFDQRGTAHSNELFCPLDAMAVHPETREQDRDAAQARLDALSIGAFSDPGEVYRAMAEASNIFDRSRCLDLFAEQRIELEQYNTASTVQDTIAVMEHLGYNTYNLYGGSYGTTVVLSILGHYDLFGDAELPSIRTAVLDSVAPPDTPFYAQGYEIAYVVLGSLEDCEADPDCAMAYPAIRDRAVSLLGKLDAQPVLDGKGADITGDALAEVLRTAVTSQPGLVSYLPRLIADLESGDTGLFELAMSVSRHETTLPEAKQPDEPAVPASVSAEVEAETEEISAKLDEVREAVQVMAGTHSFLRAAALEAEGRADILMQLFELYVRLGGMMGSTFLSALEPYILHPEQRTREGLNALIRQTVFLPALQSDMLAMVERLKPDEVSEIFATLVSPAFDTGLASIGSITNRTVTCNDRGSTIFNDVAFEAYRRFEAPQLIGFAAHWVANYQIGCEQLGLAADAYTPLPPAIESDTPTLIIAGSLDTATPAIYAYRTAETLTDATVVEIPMQGHVPGVMTECGRSLVHAFVLSPETAPNLACVESERIRFILPGDTIPEGP